MLVVLAKLMVKPEKKAELFALAQDLIAATRTEPGCLRYELMDDPYDAGACMFVEEWTDKQALEQHFQTSHIKEWRQKSKEMLAGRTTIKLFQAEEITL